jgi:hypothetical protein
MIGVLYPTRTMSSPSINLMINQKKSVDATVNFVSPAYISTVLQLHSRTLLSSKSSGVRDDLGVGPYF